MDHKGAAIFNGLPGDPKKEARLKALWSVRLANQMSALPPFDQVFREFRRALRQSDLP